MATWRHWRRTLPGSRATAICAASRRPRPRARAGGVLDRALRRRRRAGAGRRGGTATMIYALLTRLLMPLLRLFERRPAVPPRRILVVQVAKIGDAICTTPLLRELRSRPAGCPHHRARRLRRRTAAARQSAHRRSPRRRCRRLEGTGGETRPRRAAAPRRLRRRALLQRRRDLAGGARMGRHRATHRRDPQLRRPQPASGRTACGPPASPTAANA